jgi:hypothetical protein
LGEQAQRRVDWAQEEFDSGNTELGNSYLTNYVGIKKNIADKLGGVDESILEDYKTKTIDENNKIEGIKGKVTVDTQNVIEEKQTEVLQKTWEVVGEKQGTTEATHFVNIVYAPGTGPGGEGRLIVEGGTLKYAPGTSAGGTSKVVIEGGSKYAPGTSGSGTVQNTVETN